MESKPIAIGALNSANRVFTKDLEALPEEAYTQHFGGKARTVADIVHEVNLVNEDIYNNMQGKPVSEWPEGWITAPDHLKTKVEVIAAFSQLMEKIISLVESYSEEDLEAKVETEHGETNRYERCRFMALHMWYHSGQLNYVQTLLGDDGWHW